MKFSVNVLSIFSVFLGTILVYPSLQVLMASLMCNNSNPIPFTSYIESCYSGAHSWVVLVSAFGMLFLLIQYLVIKILLRELNPNYDSPYGQF